MILRPLSRSSHRTTAVGKGIGPVTTEVATAMLTTFLLAGYSVPLCLVWAFGGIASCIGWDLWLALGSHHDLALGFTANAERAKQVAATNAPNAPEIAAQLNARASQYQQQMEEHGTLPGKDGGSVSIPGYQERKTADDNRVRIEQLCREFLSDD